MNPNNQVAGIVLSCDAHGTVLRIAHDDLGAAAQFAPGKPFTLGVDRASLAKALNFLVELKTRGAAFDWELNVPLDQKVATLHFVGTADSPNYLIIGALTSAAVLELCEGMIKMTNEQTNALRLALKDQTEQARAQATHDKGLYDEITRLNNELVTAQRELARQNAELERLNEQKNRFLGLAAHDLHNPLSAIMAYSDFLLDETQNLLGAEHLEFLAIIRESSAFMLKLVDDLLDVAKIESGVLELNWQAFDLAALVERVVTLNRILAARKNIELRLLGLDRLDVALDPAKIEQALHNLISNAVKFSHPHTTVTIGLTGTSDAVTISVQDQGQGIPANEMDKLFQLYERTSVKSTAGEKSSGLGLAIAQKIVMSHGGHLRVESQVGRGTTFYVTLPIRPRAEE
jgi:signal transduction histidine kinase